VTVLSPVHSLCEMVVLMCIQRCAAISTCTLHCCGLTGDLMLQSLWTAGTKRQRLILKGSKDWHLDGECRNPVEGAATVAHASCSGPPRLLPSCSHARSRLAVPHRHGRHSRQQPARPTSSSSTPGHSDSGSSCRPSCSSCSPWVHHRLASRLLHHDQSEEGVRDLT
jgi:hypothetical protein